MVFANVDGAQAFEAIGEVGEDTGTEMPAYTVGCAYLGNGEEAYLAPMRGRSIRSRRITGPVPIRAGHG